MRDINFINTEVECQHGKYSDECKQCKVIVPETNKDLKRWFCTKCGNWIMEGQTYCAWDGYRIDWMPISRAIKK